MSGRVLTTGNNIIFDPKCDILATRNFPKGLSQQLVSLNINGRLFTVFLSQPLELTSLLVRSYDIRPPLARPLHQAPHSSHISSDQYQFTHPLTDGPSLPPSLIPDGTLSFLHMIPT